MLLHARKIILQLLVIGLLVGCSLICAAQEPSNKPMTASKPALEGPEDLRRIVKHLRSENEILRVKVSQLEKRIDGLAIRDRLVQEEQRVENLQQQLYAIGEKEAVLQGRLEEISEQLRPENIEQLQILGSTRPEEVRESTRRRLTGEQNRLRSQLELLQQSRVRLQSSLSVTDLLIQSLKSRLQMVLRP
jgi:hypothetical protein